MNIAPNHHPVPTRSGPSAAATWSFIFAVLPIIAVAAGYVAGWLYGMVFK